MLKPILPLLFTTLILLTLPSALAYNCTVSTAATITLGQPIVVCVHIVYQRSTGDVINTYAFNTTVDTFSGLKINNITSRFSAQSTPILAVIQVQNSENTTQMLVSSKNIANGIYRNVFSFVININGGTVTNITDDNAGCGDCQTSQVCNDATSNYCFSSGTQYAGSDPNFFISWIGTDTVGNYMLSHTKRLSRFSQYSIGSIYNKAVSSITSLVS